MTIDCHPLDRVARPPVSGKRRLSRPGIATTELALLAPFLLALLMGLWEIGRCIQIKNILEGAAREAGRLGGSGSYFSSSNHMTNSTPSTTLTLLLPSTNADYELQQRIEGYLKGAGLTTTGMTVTVTNTGTTTSEKNWSYTWKQSGGSSGSGFDPTAAASQLDRLSVTVTLPYSNVTWSPLNWFISADTTLTGEANWLALVDKPLTVNTNIITKPLAATDAVP